MKLNIDGKTRYSNIFLVKMNMLNVEDPTVTVKCRTAIKAMTIYINECLSVMLESFLWSFKSISFLANYRSSALHYYYYNTF